MGDSLTEWYCVYGEGTQVYEFTLRTVLNRPQPLMVNEREYPWRLRWYLFYSLP